MSTCEQWSSPSSAAFLPPSSATAALRRGPRGTVGLSSSPQAGSTLSGRYAQGVVVPDGIVCLSSCCCCFCRFRVIANVVGFD